MPAPNKQSQRARTAGGERGAMRRESKRPAGVAVLLATLGAPASGAQAWPFGEGYTSPSKGAPSEIYFRSFSLGNWKGICDKSFVPAEFRVEPTTLSLLVGGRLHRDGKTEIIIEAYHSAGVFVPHVPLIVTVLDAGDIIGTRSDWDYVEAIRVGKAELRIAWACGGRDEHVEVSVPVVVSGR